MIDRLDAFLQAVAQVVGIALALDLRADARQQLVAVDGAHDVVVDAHVEAAQQARLVAGLDQHDDRQVARAVERARLRAQPQAVGPGQRQADDEQIEILLGEQRAAPPAGRASTIGSCTVESHSTSRAAERGSSSTTRMRPAPPTAPSSSAASSLMPICRPVEARISISSVSILRRARFFTRVTSAISSTGLVRKSSAPLSQAPHLVGDLVERRHEHDGDMVRLGVGLEPAAGLEAVHAGHHDVEQDDVDALALADVERFLAAAGRENVEVLGREPRLEQLHVRQDVVDDKNSRGHLRSYSTHELELGARHRRRSAARSRGNSPTEIGLEM